MATGVCAEPRAGEGEEEDSWGSDTVQRRRDVGGVWRALGGGTGTSLVGFGYPRLREKTVKVLCKWRN